MSDLQLIPAKMNQSRVYIRNLHFLVSKNAITWELINWGLVDGLQKIVLMRRGSAVTSTFCSAYLVFSTDAQAAAVVQQWNGVNLPSLGPRELGCVIAMDLPTAPSKSKPAAESPQPPASFAPAPQGRGGFYRALPASPPPRVIRSPAAVPLPSVPPSPAPTPPVPAQPVPPVPPPMAPPQAATVLKTRSPSLPSSPPPPKLSAVPLAPPPPLHSAASSACAQLDPYGKALLQGIIKGYIIAKQKYPSNPTQSSSSSSHCQAETDDANNENHLEPPGFLVAWEIEGPYPYSFQASQYVKSVCGNYNNIVFKTF